MTIRGSRIDHLIVRMAAEGLPQLAIARVTCRSPMLVRSAILMAISDGLLAGEPVMDWPEPERRLPTNEPVPFGEIDEAAMRIRFALDWPPQYSRFAAAILILRPALKVTLLRIVPDKKDTKEKLIDTVACKMRPVLAEHGIAFESLWGLGYRLDPENRRKLLAILDAREVAARAA